MLVHAQADGLQECPLKESTVNKMQAPPLVGSVPHYPFVGLWCDLIFHNALVKLES